MLKHYYDIGMAIGSEEGLVVPVIRDADRLSFAEIENMTIVLWMVAKRFIFLVRMKELVEEPG